jgi:hypothetical protein
MLMIAKPHIERGGNPVNRIKASENIPLRITCQPIAIYFSSELLSKKFHNACMDAEKKSRTRAEIGMGLSHEIDQFLINFLACIMLHPMRGFFKEGQLAVVAQLDRGLCHF